ncbi:TetR family transcriptional regulator [uncultured Cohaesibacter sp.]|uniref:TetR family transcriptional regulator n=1 Tax=uncultured Cohaesibacter sp. TaxID=1002546 RepID=UPI00292DDFDF|nr:TetR family transcriptional regulator [uncultured Cohaesibacter sp.]
MSYLPKEQRRAEIIEATIEVIQKEGLSAATVRNVAKSIAVSPGQIHHHFESADALRSQAYLSLWGRMRQVVVEAATNKSPIEALMILISGTEDKQVKEEFKKLYKDLVDASRMSDAMRSTLHQIMNSTITDYRSLLTEAQATGDLAKTVDVQQFAVAILALSFGIGFMNDIEFGQIQIRDFVHRQIEILNKAHEWVPPGS